MCVMRQLSLATRPAGATSSIAIVRPPSCAPRAQRLAQARPPSTACSARVSTGRRRAQASRLRMGRSRAGSASRRPACSGAQRPADQSESGSRPQYSSTNQRPVRPSAVCVSSTTNRSRSRGELGAPSTWTRSLHGRLQSSCAAHSAPHCSRRRQVTEPECLHRRNRADALGHWRYRRISDAKAAAGRYWELLSYRGSRRRVRASLDCHQCRPRDERRQPEGRRRLRRLLRL